LTITKIYYLKGAGQSCPFCYEEKKMAQYRVFTRSWWKENPEYPNGLEPHAGPKRYKRAVFETEQEAREYCQEWNDLNAGGRLSVKMEFESGQFKLGKTRAASWGN
jgi:hypothetical protein